MMNCGKNHPQGMSRWPTTRPRRLIPDEQEVGGLGPMTLGGGGKKGAEATGSLVI